MRILHTADWHLGKRLHRHSLHRFQVPFVDWLLETVRARAVDAVLIAGDIFDTANPSSEARELYYSALARLHGLGCRVVVTGGNHDSPSVLQAPRQLLSALGIHVVGEKTERPEDMLVPLPDADGQPRALVAAVPFLRDADLRRMVSGEESTAREEAVREGIRTVFQAVAEAAQAHAPRLPALAMGHLFARGASTSESERDIQVGNQADVSEAAFPPHFAYVALGHIHRPQRVGQEGRIHYSGSPVPLSFSESQDQKRVILLEVSDEGIQHESLPVPAFCRLPRIAGSDLEDIAQKLDALDPAPEALIEVQLDGERYDPALTTGLDDCVAEFNRRQAHQQIVRRRARFADQATGTGSLYAEEEAIEELRPEEVFREKLKHEQSEGEDRRLLEEAFAEILEEVRQEEGPDA
jgi:exonuclease SbcD